MIENKAKHQAKSDCYTISDGRLKYAYLQNKTNLIYTTNGCMVFESEIEANEYKDSILNIEEYKYEPLQVIPLQVKGYSNY